MHNTNCDDLQYILAVAETGSLAAAARRLGVHHATVLRRIAAFEQRSQVSIFERGPRGYHLTPESTHILETVRDIDGRVEGLNRAIANQSHTITGRLKLTTTDSLCQAVVLRHSGAFRRSYPGIQIELLSRNDHLNLSRMEADLTIRPAKSLPAELQGVRICDLGFRAYAAPGYLETHNLRDVAHHEWLGVSKLLNSVPFHQWLTAQTPAPEFIFRADSFITLLAAVEAGMGVAFLPCSLGERSPKAVRVLSIPDYFSTSIWIATHPDRVRSPIIQTAISYFTDALRSDRDLLEGYLPEATLSKESMPAS